MDRTTRSARPSKGEVAFRFVACTGIALVLSYTQELRWSSGSASDPATVEANVVPALPKPDAALDACAARKTPARLVDAAARAN